MPRAKVWTTIEGVIQLTALGNAGNKGLDVSASLLLQLGITHLAGMTIGPAYLRLLIQSGGDNTLSSVGKWQTGLGLFAGGIDDGDFYDLAKGDGDFMLRDSGVYEMPGAIDTLVLPSEAAYLRFTSQSSRHIGAVGQVPFLVFQQNHGGTMNYHFVLTMMVMMP